jgi:PAS domain S-box-containing protein
MTENGTAGVLLVDDSPANLLSLEATLSGLGLDLARAASGEEALGLVECRDFAVILLDVRMPSLDGFETARRLRSRERTRLTPVIFLTAKDGDAAEAVEGYRLGAVDYLVKPVLPEILRAKVAGLAALYAERERARREADQLRLLVQGTTDYGIFMLDPQGRVATWNTGAERIKGYSAGEIVGRHFSAFYPREDVERGWPEEELRRASAGGRFEDEGWRLRKDGSRFWANVVITALRDEAGNLRGFSKLTRDLSERREREESLRKLRDELEVRVRERTAELAAANEALREADRRKDEFMAVLAHELRNPLAPISNALQVLQLKKDEATVEAVRQMVGRQVGQLKHLVGDLLDAARVTTGKVVLRNQLLDLAQFARIAANDAAGGLREAGVELAVEAPEVPVWVSGDWTRLTQVLVNLLHNASKFTPAGGRVTVAVSGDAGTARLVVRDTGEGIPPEVLPRLFTAFGQAGQDLDRSRGGLGLGLALVKGLVELHGGTVRAESEGPGRGSAFAVELPSAAEPEPLAGAASEGSSKSARRLKVLIVEDNRDSADSLRMALELSGGCEVEVAYTGPDGVEAAKRVRPHLVLCDIGLPGFSGYEVARRIRAEANGSVVLVALTGYGRDEDREEARAAGFNRHFTKPVDFAELSTVLRFATQESCSGGPTRYGSATRRSRQ